jgi:hypothetical protein
MIPEIIAASQSVKALGELLKAASELKNFNDFVAAISEINAKLMDAQVAALSSQEKQSALAKRICELEQKIVELENWNHESERYQLTSLASDILVYTVKPGKENGEPPHKLCARCYNERKKSILQRKDKSMSGTTFICHTCNSEILDHSQCDDIDPDFSSGASLRPRLL